MSPYHQSLILIGMPGAGKSTIGVMLAKQLAKDFIDTDLLIQLEHRKTLQDILHAQGYMALRDYEEKILLNVHYPNHVIATGGSAVYSAYAMQHLKQFGPVIFLDVSMRNLEQRISNMATRGIASGPDETFADIYAERRPLYLRYADIVVDCNDKNQDQVIEEIICQEAKDFATADA